MQPYMDAPALVLPHVRMFAQVVSSRAGPLSVCVSMSLFHSLSLCTHTHTHTCRCVQVLYASMCLCVYVSMCLCV